MPSLGSIGPQREEAENRIKATAAALAERYGVDNPIADLPTRSARSADIRLDLAAAALIDRQLLAGVLELVEACLAKATRR